ncbi:MAG: hypothetical protein WKF78_12490 [Candidatus Limnocylindrales bacterium]
MPRVVRSGRTPKRAWRTTRGHAKAGDDLVEDEQRAIGVGQLAEILQEARHRGDDAHVGGHRLHDDRGDPPGMRARRRRRAAARSLYGSTTVVAAAAVPGRPALPGMP